LPEEKNKVEELMNYLVLHKDTVFTQQEQVSIIFIYSDEHIKILLHFNTSGL